MNSYINNVNDNREQAIFTISFAAALVAPPPDDRRRVIADVSCRYVAYVYPRSTAIRDSGIPGYNKTVELYGSAR
jgi:hypothetical protein